jgi:hypothetical protein
MPGKRVRQRRTPKDKSAKMKPAPATQTNQQPAELNATPDQSPQENYLDRASDPALTADLALALLKHTDLTAEAIERLVKNSSILKSRKVRIAIAAHPHSPRRIALRLVREFYTFDVMQFALLPTVAADLKRAADEMLVTRIASITFGERISLARRCSGSVAAALLLDKETRVWKVALENPRLTEAAVIKALLRTNTPPALVEAICHHARWSVRHEIRMALLRNEKTSLARALEFARTLSAPQLRDVLYNSRLPEKVKEYLRKDLKGKT